MIDTDKMRAALAATPLCQNAWTEKGGDNPTMLCAVSAMVSFAGVQPDLIRTMANALGGDQWFQTFATPVLLAEYGIPLDVAFKIPRLFDAQENEWRGVTEVLAMCEAHNMEEMHEAAIYEDAIRFPQHTCAERHEGRGVWISGSAMTITWDSCFDMAHYGTPVKAEKIPKLPKKAKQKNAPWLGKDHRAKVLGY
jgi:hypothetical protein